MRSSQKPELKSYYAPLPEGKGVMIFNDGDTTHRYAVDSIVDISNEKGSDRIYIYREDNYTWVTGLNMHALEDMRLRALRGEIARYAEYNELGLRIDGSQMIMMQDYEIKQKIALQRQSQKRDKVDLTTPIKAPELITVERPASTTQQSVAEQEQEKDSTHAPKQNVTEGGASMTFDTSSIPVAPSMPEPAIILPPLEDEEIVTAPLENIHEIGENIEGKGVYVGPYEYDWKPRKQEPLSRVFDVYASIHDVRYKSQNRRLTASFNDVLDAVAGIENHLGYAGIRIPNAFSFAKHLQADVDYQMLENWFLPPLEILSKQIHFNRARGVLDGTFCVDEGQKAVFSSSFFPACYATISADGHENPKVVNFRTGKTQAIRKSTQISARPIRMELRK